jgi:hypothetical protein
MAQTLRRSKSKYGRTRRQRQQKKQRQMHGGFSFDDFISKFKPSTPAEKCKAAKEAAQTACSNVEGDIELMPISDTKPVGEAPVGEALVDNSTTPVVDYTSSTTPVVDYTSTKPVGDYTSTKPVDYGATQEDDDDDDYNNILPKNATPQQQPQPQSLDTQVGGAKKSKKKNKKRSQSHRKKHKSRKHKK